MLDDVVKTIMAVYLVLVEGAAGSLSTGGDAAWLSVAVAVGELVRAAVDVEFVAARAFDEGWESAGVGAGRLALNPDNPVVGLVTGLDLLAVSDVVDGKSSTQEWEKESGLLEEHFDGWL